MTTETLLYALVRLASLQIAIEICASVVLAAYLIIRGILPATFWRK